MATSSSETEDGDKDIHSLLSRAVATKSCIEIKQCIDDGRLDEELSMKAIAEASKYADDIDFYGLFLSVQMNFPDLSLDHAVVETVVARGLWVSAEAVLQEGVSDELRRWVVEEKIKHLDSKYDSTMGIVFNFCFDDQLDSVLRQLAACRLWSILKFFLSQRAGGVSDELRRWVVEEAIKHFDSQDDSTVNVVARFCFDDQLDSVLRQFAARGWWSRLDGILSERADGVSDEVRRWVVEEAIKHLESQSNFTAGVVYVVGFCFDDQLDSVLRQLAARRWWSALDRILSQRAGGVSDEVRRWIVAEARRDTACRDIALRVLPHCPDDQLRSVLGELVDTRSWEAVGKTLKRHLEDALHKWVVEEAANCTDGEVFAAHILPQCADRHLDSVLTYMVTRGLWAVAGKVLWRCVGNERRTWAVEEAMKHAEDREAALHVLPHCSDGQMDCVLNLLAANRQWESLGQVLQRNVSEAQREWAVDKALAAGDEEAAVHVLPHCPQAQLEQVVGRALASGSWEVVRAVWKQRAGSEVLTWVAVKAAERDLMNKIIPHCSGDELATVLPHLVQRGLWEAVGKVLQRGVDEQTQKRTIDEAINQADDFCFQFFLLSLVPDTQLDPLLDQLVARGLWCSVGMVLRRGTSQAWRQWAVGEAVSRASDYNVNELLPYVADAELESVLVKLVERSLWICVDGVLQRGVSDAQRDWVLGEAAKGAEGGQETALRVLSHCPDEQLPQVLEQLVLRDMWSEVQTLLKRGVSQQQHTWTLEQAMTRAHDDYYASAILQDYPYAPTVSQFFTAASRNLPQTVKILRKRLHWDKELSQLLFLSIEQCSLMYDEESMMSIGDSAGTSQQENIEFQAILSDIVLFLKDQLSCCRHDKLMVRLAELTQWTSRLDSLNNYAPGIVSTLKRLITDYHECRSGHFSDMVLFRILSMVPVLPNVQNIGLELMLKKKRWKVISHAHLCRVWEHVRRSLFGAAVSQGQWGVVRQWADHALYDDQRGVALEAACRRKQWRVFVQLADHGLKLEELVHVYYRVANHADWDAVLQLLERGADVTELTRLSEVDRRTLMRRDRDEIKRQQQRRTDLLLLGRRLRRDSQDFDKALKQQNWRAVFFRLFHKANEGDKDRALACAVEGGAWHVVLQLVKRLGLSSSQRDSLLDGMVRRGQWGVCRALLEAGVSVPACREAGARFVDRGQWLLVARVMEHDVGDATRRHIMRRALESGEGSVVWHGLLTMQGQLADAERDELFRQALKYNVWQAIKPLVKQTDSLGISHRDTALLKAIDHHQWDVVDLCQSHDADMDLKSKGRLGTSMTPLLSKALSNDWEAVEELVTRGADVSVVDYNGESVLHKAIREKRWKTVKLLVQYHGKLNLPDKRGRTPLQMLIDQRQASVIELALWWEPDLSSARNKEGETTLHAVCAVGWRYTMYYLVARGSDPLAVTKKGDSVLTYAVKNKKWPQTMVAQCIRLGLSTHQPLITGNWYSRDTRSFPSPLTRLVFPLTRFVSPLEHAMGQKSLVLMHMLYESGSCSGKELHRLRGAISYKYSGDEFEAARRYLEKVASTPRSLKSACRLAISHCLDVRGKRHKMVPQLPLWPELKNYVMFSDLTDPDYGKDMLS